MASLILSRNTISVKLNGECLEVTATQEDYNFAKIQSLQVPLYDLDRVIVMGTPTITLSVIHKLISKRIPICLLNSKGRYCGQIVGQNNGNVARRLQQYELYSNLDKRLEISSKIIYAKIRNSRRLLQRLSANRHESNCPKQIEVSNSLKRLSFIALKHPKDLDTLRGYEGIAMAKYFSRLQDFFPVNLPFSKRSRRPPRNEANSLLSFTYTIFQCEIDAALQVHGLDIYLGVNHAIDYNRPSLSLDILELFRSCFCDALVLHLLNHKILKKDAFEIHDDDQGIYLKKEYRKTFFEVYEQYMLREFTIRSQKSKVDFRKIIELQVIALINAIEGKNDYNFFLMP